MAFVLSTSTVSPREASHALSSSLSNTDRHESSHMASSREPALVLSSSLSIYIYAQLSQQHTQGSPVQPFLVVLSRTEGEGPSQCEMKPPSLSSRCVLYNPFCSLSGPSYCTLTCPKLSGFTSLCFYFALLSHSCKSSWQERFGWVPHSDEIGPAPRTPKLVSNARQGGRCACWTPKDCKVRPSSPDGGRGDHGPLPSVGSRT
jgi:hypothetical protein